MSSTLQNLKGKVAIITGASSGIGRGTALELSKRGASVVVGARRVAELEKLVAEITAAGGQAVAVKLDVTDEKDQANIVKVAVEQFGKLDIAFNNAGMGTPGMSWEQSKEDFEHQYAVNVTGVFLSMKHQILAMKSAKPQGGVIINNASIVGTTTSLAMKGMAAYASSKHAVIGLTEQIACEVAEFGIRVVAVNPGPVLTDGLPKEVLESFAQNVNLPGFKKLMEVADIAKAVAFLASDDARFITATSLNIAGGAFKVI